MPTTMPFPFDSEQIDLKQVIQWIAETILHDEHKTVAKKRVRERIRYATGNDEIIIIRKDNKEFVDAQTFLLWALSKWPELIAVSGFPQALNHATGTITLSSLSCDASGYGLTIPSDAEELENAYIKAETECQRLLVENKQLRTKNAALEAEVTTWRGKYTKMSLQGSEDGKKGKGIKHNKK